MNSNDTCREALDITMEGINLNQWSQQPVLDVQKWLIHGLMLTTDELDMTFGILSQVRNQHYFIRAVYSPLGDVFKAGMAFELQDTYCSEVCHHDKTITYRQVGKIPHMVLHPVYTAMQLESYIGTPVHGINGEVLGTLNFSSHKVRPTPFEESEIHLVEQMARRISERLNFDKDE